ncbi:MAG: hypothetical protein ACF787_03145 [Rhodopirellula sp. JB053]
MDEDTEVLLGQHRLRFAHLDDTASGQEMVDSGKSVARIDRNGLQGCGAELTLSWGDIVTKRKLLRSVTILGEGHPSILRARGRGLRRCDHAIICVDNRIWIVDLNRENALAVNEPGSKGGWDTSDSVCELKSDGLYYQIGDMKISIGDARSESEQSIKRRRYVRKSSNQITCEPRGVAGDDVTETPVVCSGNLLGTEEVHGGAKVTQESLCRLKTAGSTNLLRSESSGHREDAEAAVAMLKSARASSVVSMAAQEVLEGEESAIEGFDCPELFTSHITSRLVTINRTRITKRKIVYTFCTLAVFAAAVGFLVWLAL